MTFAHSGQHEDLFSYIDVRTGNYLDDDCGKCNHESSCGYHYPPKEFFADNPSNRPNGCNSVANNLIPVKPKQLCTIPMCYVNSCHGKDSVFMKWLQLVVSNHDAYVRVCRDYYLGATKDGRVIFWQIDIRGRVRTGKIMDYSHDGHRKGNPDWVHSQLMNHKKINTDWVLSQCLFGEHLIKPDGNDICLVESEKTAIICSAYYPQFVWVSTGGCKQLSQEKCLSLRGHKVIVYPDSGMYQDWTTIMKQTGLKYVMIDKLEEFPPNTDIADLLLAELFPFIPKL